MFLSYLFLFFHSPPFAFNWTIQVLEPNASIVYGQEANLEECSFVIADYRFDVSATYVINVTATNDVGMEQLSVAVKAGPPGLI